MQTFPLAQLSRVTALGLALAFAGLSISRPALAGDDAPGAAAPAAAPAPAAAAPAAAPAPAAKKPTEKARRAARKAYGEGEKAFAAGKFDEAYAAFQKAHTEIPSPHAQYWIAKSLDQAGKTQEAISAYQAFLQAPEAASAGEDKVADAKTRLETLELSLVGQLALESEPPGALVAVDGQPHPEPTPTTLKLAPGTHKIGLTAPGYEPAEISVEAKAGEKLAQKLELTATPAPAPPAPPPPPPPPPPAPAPAAEPRSMVPAYVTLGIAGVGAVVGTIFGIQALKAKSDFDETPTQASADDAERNALVADMAFGVAVTLGVTGIVLLTSPPEEAAESSAARLELRPYAGPKSGGASARLSF